MDHHATQLYDMPDSILFGSRHQGFHRFDIVLDKRIATFPARQGAMDDIVAILGCFYHGVNVADVTLHKLYIEAADVGSLAPIMYQHTHFGVFMKHQLFYQLSADESRTPRDKHAFALKSSQRILLVSLDLLLCIAPLQKFHHSNAS